MQVCPGEVTGLFFNSPIITLGSQAPLIVPWDTGAPGAALNEARSVSVPPDSDFWFYVTAQLLPVPTSSLYTHYIMTQAPQPVAPLFITSTLAPEHPYRQTHAPPGRSGRLWVPIARLNTNSNSVTRLEQLHTGDIKVIVK